MKLDLLSKLEYGLHTPPRWWALKQVYWLMKWRRFHKLNRPFESGRRASVLQPQKPTVQQDSRPLSFVFSSHVFLLSLMDLQPRRTSSSTAEHTRVLLCLNPASQNFFFYNSSFDKCCIKNRKYSVKKKSRRSRILFMLCEIYEIDPFLSLFDTSWRCNFSALNTVWLHVLLTFLQAAVLWKSFNKLLAIKKEMWSSLVIPPPQWMDESSLVSLHRTQGEKTLSVFRCNSDVKARLQSSAPETESADSAAQRAKEILVRAE